jgi:hypothetical protein
LFEFGDKHPGQRPFGWWLFDADEPRDENLDEADQLERMGRLTDHEREILERRAAERRKAGVK